MDVGECSLHSVEEWIETTFKFIWIANQTFADKSQPRKEPVAALLTTGWAAFVRIPEGSEASDF